MSAFSFLRRLTLLALPLAAALGAQAVPVAKLTATDFVNDFAHALPSAAVTSLDAQAKAIEDQYQVQVALVTVATTGDQAVGDYAYQLAERWGVGAKTGVKTGAKKDTGLLVLLAIHDRKDSTQVGYGLEPYITDADAGQWMRDQQQALRAGDYGAAFSGILDQVSSTLAQRMGGAPPGATPPPQARGPRGNGNPNPLAVILVLLAIGFLFSRLSGRGGGGCLLPWLMMGGMGGGRGGGGFGGGGFGGGGGGFGGFGGGGFGGGGASGGW